jgi:hypothetical protein
MSKSDEGIRFVSGLNAETMGRALQDDHDSFGSDVLMWVNDFSRFDCHCGVGYSCSLCIALTYAGVAEPIVDASVDSKPRGSTPHGVTYSAHQGLCSGAPETSDGGSLWNATATGAAFNRFALTFSCVENARIFQDQLLPVFPDDTEPVETTIPPLESDFLRESMMDLPEPPPMYHEYVRLTRRSFK